MKLLARCLAALAGILLTYRCVPELNGRPVWRSVIALALVSLLAGANNLTALKKLLNSLNALGPRGRRILATVIFLTSFGYFTVSAVMCDRAFHPTWHDDQMHAVQARMLAGGHLWLPPHPMHEFFDTFHIFMTPVYAPIHFPGTAMLNVFGIWLHLPFSALPLMLISLACAVSYLLLSEVLNGTAGILATMVLWASSDARMLATMPTSHNAMIFFGALMLWLFVQWQKKPTLGWSIALGVIIGWSAITRPVDAIAFAIPIAIAMIYQAIRQPKIWLMLPPIVACCVPFLTLQLYFDHAVTGSWLKPPYQAYNDLFHPASSYASDRFVDLLATPMHVSDLAQKQMYYENFVLPWVRDYVNQGALHRLWNVRLPMTFGAQLPFVLLIFFLPFGLFAINTMSRWVVGTPVLFYLALYYPHVFYLAHYPPIVLISMTALAAIGMHYCCQLIEKRWQNAEPLLFTAAVLAAVMAVTPLSFMFGFETSSRQFAAVDFAYEQLPSRVQAPALVFCRFNPWFKYAPFHDDMHDEPVYNSATAKIDDSPIVLAQSLGSRNIELVRYYASRGQNRHVYEFDRRTLTIRPFGTVNELVANEAATTSPATSPTTSPSAAPTE